MKLGDLTFQMKIKVKIQEVINIKNSSVSLELNYGEIRGDGNLEIMLTEIQYELLERLPSELDPKTLNSNLEEPAVNLTFSSNQLKEMKLIRIIEPNYKLIDLLNNPRTRRALNLSLTPEMQNLLEGMSEQTLNIIEHLITNLNNSNDNPLTLFTITKDQIRTIVKGLIAIFSVLAKPISLEELNNLINDLNQIFLENQEN